MYKVIEEKYEIENQGVRFTPRGAFPRETTLRFSLRIQGEGRADQAVLRIHNDESGDMTLCPMEEIGGDGRQFQTEVSLAALCGDMADGLFYYCYDVYHPDGCITYGGEAPDVLCPVGEEGKRQLLVYREDAAAPDWLCGGIMYHVFVDRFCASGRARPKPGTVMNPDWENGIPQFASAPGEDLPNNEFFGGDLFGLAEKMEYIASLGVTCLYLSPVFEAASNHKYDTADYGRVDPMFGGEEGLAAVLVAARAHGIRVILDGVFNHTGADSVYFNKFSHYDSVGAYQSKESSYYPWYCFFDYPDGYESWWGIPILPKVRGDEPSFREYILGEEGIAAKWLRFGVSGWRLDVADELTDGFLTALHHRVRATDPDAVVYGEVWEDATSKVAYGSRRRYLRGEQLDSVMNYPLRDAVIAYIRYGDHEKFRRVAEGISRRYPKFAADLLMNHLGTHDTARILTALVGDPPDGYTNGELAVKRLTKEQRAHGVRLLMLAYALISVMPGVPCIFYGDEAGVEGYGDPFCRMPYPWGREEETLLAHYRRIGVWRRGEPVLRDGEIRILRAMDSHLVLVRENGRDPAVLLILNRSETEIAVSLSVFVSGIDTTYSGDEPAVPPLTACFYRCPDGIRVR